MDANCRASVFDRVCRRPGIFFQRRFQYSPKQFVEHYRFSVSADVVIDLVTLKLKRYARKYCLIEKDRPARGSAISRFGTISVLCDHVCSKSNSYSRRYGSQREESPYG